MMWRGRKEGEGENIHVLQQLHCKRFQCAVLQKHPSCYVVKNFKQLSEERRLR